MGCTKSKPKDDDFDAIQPAAAATTSIVPGASTKNSPAAAAASSPEAKQVGTAAPRPADVTAEPTHDSWYESYMHRTYFSPRGGDAPTESQRAASVKALSARNLYTRDSTRTYPVTNNHPSLQEISETTFSSDPYAKWLVMLPQPAVQAFQLEPNFNDGDSEHKDLWVGRMWQFRRIRWLQYCTSRRFSVRITSAAKAELAQRYAEGTEEHEALIKLQRWNRGWYTRYRSNPQFLELLVGKNIRTIMVFMHGSGGLVWGNVRFGRVAAGYGCVVFMPDHMSTDEGRARHLGGLHTSTDDTDYWQNNLFYTGKKEATGESLDFSTSVDGVLSQPEYYKTLYEKYAHRPCCTSLRAAPCCVSARGPHRTEGCTVASSRLPPAHCPESSRRAPASCTTYSSGCRPPPRCSA